MTANDVLDKIQHLPKDVQEHLFLYVDFLFNTYQVHGESATDLQFFKKHELTAEGKEFLEQRITEAKTHPDKQVNWREARKKIHEKHNLPQ
ncbi:MAG: hypothetical protein IPM82_28310 [Saprospiraceae bacterium]|nr:hypothetical protein [Saprospiraceae bacterium]